ncbi:unnamed protein product, partial [Meganyctiphanes norvegica]
HQISYKYSLNADYQYKTSNILPINNSLGTGNELQLSFTCEAQYNQIHTQPTTPPLPTNQSAREPLLPTKEPTAPQPLPQPQSPSTTIDNEKITDHVPIIGAVTLVLLPSTTTYTDRITDHVPIIAAVTFVFTLMVIILAVILVIRCKRRNHNPVVIQPTDHLPRLSRHVSENSLYESYDNHHTDSTNTRTTTNVTNSTNQRRGSAHDSENSLYMRFN